MYQQTNNNVFNYLPSPVKDALMLMEADKRRNLEEVRLRAGGAVVVNCPGAYFLTPGGATVKKAAGALTITREMLRRSLDRMCQNSVYSAQNELKNGFVTLPGGHRAGVCGRTVVNGGKVSSLSDISSINLRIARQVRGTADGVMEYIAGEGLKNTIIISPPACGKTTLLRDIARQLAGGRYMYRVGIVDERSELASMHSGEAQNDVGTLSDVYDSCPKSEGMLMLLRSMSPDVIITDEIGSEDDAAAIHSLINAGVRIICTAHGYDRDDLLRRRGVAQLLNDGVFERIVVLSRRLGPGTVEKMY